VLFRGLGITDDMMKPFADKTFHAHNSLPHLMFTFFRDVVCAHGVEVEEIKVTPSVTTAPKPIRAPKSTRDQRRREKRARRVNHR
jgi:hypothetical protein